MKSMKKTLSSSHLVSFHVFRKPPLKTVWNIHCEELHFSSCSINFIFESFERLSSIEKKAIKKNPKQTLQTTTINLNRNYVSGHSNVLVLDGFLQSSLLLGLNKKHK